MVDVKVFRVILNSGMFLTKLLCDLTSRGIYHHFHGTFVDMNLVSYCMGKNDHLQNLFSKVEQVLQI